MGPPPDTLHRLNRGGDHHAQQRAGARGVIHPTGMIGGDAVEAQDRP